MHLIHHIYHTSYWQASFMMKEMLRDQTSKVLFMNTHEKECTNDMRYRDTVPGCGSEGGDLSAVKVAI